MEGRGELAVFSSVIYTFTRVEGESKFNDLYEPIADSNASSFHIDTHVRMYVMYEFKHTLMDLKYCKVNGVIPILYMYKLRLREVK